LIVSLETPISRVCQATDRRLAMYGKFLVLSPSLFPQPVTAMLRYLFFKFNTLLISLTWPYFATAFSGIEATEDKVGSTPDTTTIITRSPSGHTLSKAVSSKGDRFWSNIVPSFVKRDASTNAEGGKEIDSSSTLLSCCWSGSSGTKN